MERRAARPRTPRTLAGTVVAAAAVGAVLVGPAAAGAAPPAAVPHRCHTAALSARGVDAQGAAGNVYVDFRLRNVSRSICTVQGYVGVQLLGVHDRRLPTRLRRERGPQPRIVLRPGQSDFFFLHFPNPGIVGPGCHPQTALHLLVTPPDEFTSLYVSGRVPGGGYPVRPCGGRLSTAPLRARQ